jgi:hypothetical protein
MTQEDVDRLVEAFDKKNPVSDEFRRIRRGLQEDEDDEVESKGNGRRLKSINGGQVLGVSIDRLAEEAGLVAKER